MQPEADESRNKEISILYLSILYTALVIGNYYKNENLCSRGQDRKMEEREHSFSFYTSLHSLNLNYFSRTAWSCLH